MLLVAVACDATAPPISAVVPACGDPVAGRWDARMVLPGPAGLDASVTSLLAGLGGTIVGGQFDTIVGQPIRNIARWDGHQWTALGDGLPGIVTGLALDDAGTLWATGSAVRYTEWSDYVARWDGLRWSMLAASVDRIAGIAAVRGGVAVYGQFGAIGGVPAAGLAVWDGARWTDRGLTDSAIFTLARTAAGFCVGGGITAPADGVAQTGAACWDGGRWAPLGPPLGPIIALARAPDGRWWAGGVIAQPLYDTHDAGGIAYLGDDGAWHPVDGGVADRHQWDPQPVVDAIAFDGADVIVGGPFDTVGSAQITARGLARWNPAQGWSAVVGDGLDVQRGSASGINAVLVDRAGLHVAGTFAGIGGTAATGVATIARDGAVTAWTGDRPALAPQGRVAAVAAAGARVLIAGGVNAPGIAPAAAAWFDGTWHALPARARPDLIMAVAALPDGTPVLSADHVARLDGSGWATLSPSWTRGSPVLVDTDGAVYFGVPDDATGTTAVMRWREGAVTWLGAIDDPLAALVAFDGELVAATTHGAQDDTVASRLWVRRADGAWQLIDGGPPGGIVDATVSPALGVVVATWFGDVAAWDGVTWRGLPGPRATAVAGCADGVFTAGAALTFVDRARARVLALDLGGPARAPSTASIKLAVDDGAVDVVVQAPGLPGLRRWLLR